MSEPPVDPPNGDVNGRPSAQDSARVAIEEIVSRFRGAVENLDADARGRIEQVATRFALLATDIKFDRAAPDEVERRRERLLATAASDLAIIPNLATVQAREVLESALAGAFAAVLRLLVRTL